MRKLYGMIALMSLLASLAGIGSFFVAVMPLVNINSEYSQSPSARLPQADQPPAVGNEPVTQERDRRREELMRVCNWAPYEQKAKRLRESYVRNPQSPLPSYVWLGTDTEFEYFYDFGADVVFCRRRGKPGGPLVSSGGGSRNHEAERRKLVVLLIGLMAACVGLLHLIQVFRGRRHDRR